MNERFNIVSSIKQDMPRCKQHKQMRNSYIIYAAIILKHHLKESLYGLVGILLIQRKSTSTMEGAMGGRGDKNGIKILLMN